MFVSLTNSNHMFVSYNWLKDHVKLPDSLTPEELAERLTMSTVEVDGLFSQEKSLANIVVGLVKKVSPHPGADRLQVCLVADGTGEKQVVCGGSNVRAGMKVALAQVGARIKWHGEGETITLEPAKIRGVESQGMICASSEIGLSEMFPLREEKEILDLSTYQAAVGTPLAQALGMNDAIFDIDNKSMNHRPDLWGHYGLAREVAALTKRKLKEYRTAKITSGQGLRLRVEVKDQELCPRYMAVAVGGIKIKESPAWLRQRLLNVGLRPINNLVDITNYILMDLGQPLHAFDARLLSGSEKEKTIVARRAKSGETFTTLDEKEHKLTEDMLVIADQEKAVAVAGVMGGLNSGINVETQTVIFESANFQAANIRQTTQKLGIRTDSSARFEKSLDPHLTKAALEKAVAMTKELCPGAKVVSVVVDEKDFHLFTSPIILTDEFLRKKIGMEIPRAKVKDILTSLGFCLKEKRGELAVTVPTWRATKDITRPEDLVEEISRIYGYGNIPVSLPKFAITPPLVNEERRWERLFKEKLAWEFGFTEVSNYSFLSPRLIEKAGLTTNEYLELDNPIAKDRPFLRRELWLGLLENLENNQPYGETLKLFEVGRVFEKEFAGQREMEKSDGLLPRQNIRLGLAVSGKYAEPFYLLSEALGGLLGEAPDNWELKKVVAVKNSAVHPGRVAEITVKGKIIGVLAEVHPEIQEKFGLLNRTAFLELDLTELLTVWAGQKHYRPLPLYPAVNRDLAVVVEQTIEQQALVQEMLKTSPLLQAVELFDVYVGSKIGENKKSLAFHLTYRSEIKTLSAEEVVTVHQQVRQRLEKKFQAETRE